MTVGVECELKKKVIREFQQFLCKVRKGHRPDYEFILEEISLLEKEDNMPRTAFQYYLNNKWQEQY